MAALVLALLLSGPPDAADQQVQLDFPDTVEVQVVIDYVAATLGLNVIYDDSLLKKSVALRVAGPVPKDSLEGILQTLLRSRGLALVDAEQPGWLKVVPIDKVNGETGPLRHDVPADVEGSEILTYVLPIRHAELERVKTAIEPYLSKPGGTLQLVPESRLVLITDCARTIRQIEEIAALIDVEGEPIRMATIPVRNQDPAELADLVGRLLAEEDRLQPGMKRDSAPSLQPDPLGGGLIVLGFAGQIERARELVERFDAPRELRSEVYQPRFMTATRLRTLTQQLAGEVGVRVVADDASNTLFVTARDSVHRRIRDLIDQLDTSTQAAAAPLRFYKLLNRRADDVFATLGGLLGGQLAGDEVDDARDGSSGSKAGPIREDAQSGPIQLPPRPPADRKERDDASRSAGGMSIRGEDFSIALDEHTNSIIVMAKPEMHRQIEQLIAQLDKRRPQVLVEVTLVSITVDDSLSLGVELNAIDLGDPWDYLLFTSFGLSAYTPTTGQRRLSVAPGGTGVLLAPDEVPIILEALQTSGNTHVFAAPRILVDDNATGRIESVSESPFTSVNASDTVATTSFAGFAKAGTQLTIEPHIAEGDHLEVNYSLTVSSFTGSGSGAAPPPRSSDTISSTIRVPDGHTVVVGGLLTETLGESVSQVPLVGDVPVLGWLFGTRSRSNSKVRLYAFIRPTVLRDDGFEDLKYISREDLRTVEVDDGFPPDRFQTMR